MGSSTRILCLRPVLRTRIKIELFLRGISLCQKSNKMMIHIKTRKLTSHLITKTNQALCSTKTPPKTSSKAMSHRWLPNFQATRLIRTRMRSQAHWILLLRKVSTIRANGAYFQEILGPMAEIRLMKRKLKTLRIGSPKDRTSPKTLWADSHQCLQLSWVLIKTCLSIDKCLRQTCLSLVKNSPKMQTQRPKLRVTNQLVHIRMKFRTPRANNTIILKKFRD